MLTEVREKEALEIGLGGEPGVSCLCPLFPSLQVSCGPLEVRGCMPVGEGNGTYVLPVPIGRAHTGSFVLRVFRVFISLLQVKVVSG